jgi:hypothetical protein
MLTRSIFQSHCQIRNWFRRLPLVTGLQMIITVIHISFNAITVFYDKDVCIKRSLKIFRAVLHYEKFTEIDSISLIGNSY